MSTEVSKCQSVVPFCLVGLVWLFEGSGVSSVAGELVQRAYPCRTSFRLLRVTIIRLVPFPPTTSFSFSSLHQQPTYLQSNPSLQPQLQPPQLLLSPVLGINSPTAALSFLSFIERIVRFFPYPSPAAPAQSPNFTVPCK